MVPKKISVVVVCCFLLAAFALPAFAYDTPSDLWDTLWYFDEVLTGSDWGGSARDVWGLQMSLSFGASGQYSNYVDLYYDGSRLVTYLSSDGSELVLYDAQSGGWNNSAFKYMRFELAPQDPSPDFIEWLAKNAVNIGSGNTYFPIVTVSVSGVLNHDALLSFTFAGSRPSSAISLYVDEEGGTFTHGLRSFFVPSVDASRFQGFDGDGDGVADFVPGQSYEIGAGYNVATTVALSAVYDETSAFVTSLAIRSNSGSSTYVTEAFTGYGSSPLVRVEVKGYGADIYSDGVLVNSFRLENSDEFLGFATRRNSSIATYAVGSTITIGGTADNAGIELFTVYRSAVATPDADFTSWIITAVGGFFAFELWPGLSLGDLVLTVISIGVLFAFLKITI